VLVVVQLHGRFVDIRLKRRIVVWECWKFISHGRSPLVLSVADDFNLVSRDLGYYSRRDRRPDFWYVRFFDALFRCRDAVGPAIGSTPLRSAYCLRMIAQSALVLTSRIFTLRSCSGVAAQVPADVAKRFSFNGFEV
jgi:hypothetical protein